MQMLDDLLQLNPRHPKALWCRSQLHQKSSRHQAAFLDLHKLQQVNPSWPGLSPALQQAAGHCRAQREAQKAAAAGAGGIHGHPRYAYARVRRGGVGGAAAGYGAYGKGHESSGIGRSLEGGMSAAYAALGIRGGVGFTGMGEFEGGGDAVNPEEVRRVYKQLVTKWHPDKWGTAAVEQQTAAAERFKVVQGAYEALKAAGLAA